MQLSHFTLNKLIYSLFYYTCLKQKQSCILNILYTSVQCIYNMCQQISKELSNLKQSTLRPCFLHLFETGPALQKTLKCKLNNGYIYVPQVKQQTQWFSKSINVDFKLKCSCAKINIAKFFKPPKIGMQVMLFLFYVY